MAHQLSFKFDMHTPRRSFHQQEDGGLGMISRRRSLQLFSIGPLLGPSLVKAAPPPAITVYEARRIITMEPSLSTARFVAVADGIILGLGEMHFLLF